MRLKYCTLIYKQKHKDKGTTEKQVSKVRCHEGNVMDSVYYKELERGNERLTAQITIRKEHFRRELGTLARVEMNGLTYKVTRTQFLKSGKIMLFLSEVQ